MSTWPDSLTACATGATELCSACSDSATSFSSTRVHLGLAGQCLALAADAVEFGLSLRQLLLGFQHFLQIAGALGQQVEDARLERREVGDFCLHIDHLGGQVFAVAFMLQQLAVLKYGLEKTVERLRGNAGAEAGIGRAVQARLRLIGVEHHAGELEAGRLDRLEVLVQLGFGRFEQQCVTRGDVTPASWRFGRLDQLGFDSLWHGGAGGDLHFLRTGAQEEGDNDAGQNFHGKGANEC